LNIFIIFNWSFFSLLWVFRQCDSCHLFFNKTLLFAECFHFITLIFALIGWLLFMPRVRLSSLYLLMSLESRVLKKCMCAMFGFHSRTIHVSKDDAYDANNIIIRLFIRFQSLVTLV
jgi:hypothetical protein